VKIGDTVTATVEITALNAEKARVTLATVCTVKGEPVLEGEALVAVPSRAMLAERKAAKEAAE
jgi:3-hydroxybutyryl-CoA dehydratase